MKFKTLLATIAATLMVFPPISITPASAAVNVYTTPGYHTVNGRDWHTICEKYSSVVDRCTTNIKASQIKVVRGKYQSVKGWAFNNLTYLPSPRATWGTNPLARKGSWTSNDGREWRTECDTAVTGRNGCRSYAMATVIEPSGKGFKKVNKMVFNNMVNFSVSTSAPVTTPPVTTPPTPSDCSAPRPNGNLVFHPKDESCQVQLINKARVKAGIAPLVRDSKLDTIARNWSMTMAQKGDRSGFYHNPNFAKQIIEAIPESAGMGENIAYNFDDRSAERTFDQFWNSPGHKENMMEAAYVKVGLGVVCSTEAACYTTQNFVIIG